MLATRPRQTHLRASLRVMAPTRLTVVLVGQTGNGKSATGNSLLGREAFVARRSLQSVTERCRVRYAALDADDEPIVPGDPAVGVDEDAGDSQAVDGAQGRGHPRNVRQRRAARGQPQAHQRLPEGRGAGGRVHRRRRRRRRGRGGSGRRGVARAGSGPLRGDEIHAGGGRRSGAARAAPGRGRHAPLRGHLHQGRRARRRRRPRRRFRAIRAADAPSAPRAHGPPRARHPADPRGERPARRFIKSRHRARAVAHSCPRTRQTGRGREAMRPEPSDVRREGADGGVRRRRRGPVHRGARRVGQTEATDGVRADGGGWWGWRGPAEERDGGGGDASVFGFAGAVRGARAARGRSRRQLCLRRGAGFLVDSVRRRLATASPTASSTASGRNGRTRSRTEATATQPAGRL